MGQVGGSGGWVRCGDKWGGLLGRQGDRGTGEGDTWGTGGEDRYGNRGGIGKIDEGLGEGDSSALFKI